MKPFYSQLLTLFSLVCGSAFADNLGVLATVNIHDAREKLEITFKNADLGDNNQTANSDFICSVEYQVDLIDKDSYRAIVLGHRVQVKNVLVPYGEPLNFNINPRLGYLNTIIDDVKEFAKLKCSYSNKSEVSKQSEAALNSLSILFKNNQASEAKDFLSKYKSLIDSTNHAYFDLGRSDYSPTNYSDYADLKSLLSTVQHFNINETPFFSLALDKELNGKSCINSKNVICGFEYKNKRSKFCVGKEPKFGNGKPCGVKSYKAKRGKVCGFESQVKYAANSCPPVYKGGRGLSECGCMRHVFNVLGVKVGCAKAKYCRHRNFGISHYTKCKTRTTYKNCAHSSFGVAEFKSCRNKEFGMEYISCRHESHGAESVNSCDIKIDESNKLSVALEGCGN